MNRARFVAFLLLVVSVHLGILVSAKSKRGIVTRYHLTRSLQDILETRRLFLSGMGWDEDNGSEFCGEYVMDLIKESFLQYPLHIKSKSYYERSDKHDLIDCSTVTYTYCCSELMDLVNQNTTTRKQIAKVTINEK